MSNEHNERLRSNLDEFVQKMTPDGVITKVKSRKILTDEHESNINSVSAGGNRPKKVWSSHRDFDTKMRTGFLRVGESIGRDRTVYSSKFTAWP